MPMVDIFQRLPLLSPPVSPHMSPLSSHSTSSSWHDSNLKLQDPMESSGSCSTFPTPSPGSGTPITPVDAKPSLPRSHPSFPYSIGTTGDGQNIVNGGGFRHNSESSCTSEPFKSELSEVNDSDLALSKQSGSPSCSPRNRLTPNSTDADHEEVHGQTNEGSSANAGQPDDGEEKNENGEQPKTAAERRAEKRKMKRFRLTHNQTRFLMSEFTRQAHPDAAHRERLSREIPGLSPRQVQVWFQNRRAKLKRLTSDDRERMLKSRALPEDFDMTQVLYSPYGSQPPSGAPLTSPNNFYSTHPEAGALRPLVIDNMKRSVDDDYVTSPLSPNSGYGNCFGPPGTGPTSNDSISPVSTASDRAALFTSLSNSQTSSPRTSNPFTRSSSFSGAYQRANHPQIPRLQLHDRVSRSRAESLGSPLRTSISYTGSPLDYGDGLSPTGMNMPYSGHHGLGSPVPQSPLDNTSAPYGIGNHNNHLQGFQPQGLSRVRTMPTSLSMGLHMKTEGSQSPSQHSPANEYPFSQLNTPFSSGSFDMPYSQANSSTMSLPGSLFPFGQQPEPQETERSSVDHGVHSQSIMDPSRPRAYTTHFELATGQ